MSLDAEKVKKIYSGYVAWHYDMPISHIFDRYKRKVFEASSMKAGDKVLLYCCGSGLDFLEIINKIGKSGKIIGVDFSTEMLKIAQNKIDKYNWNNIELVKADVTKHKHNTFDFDVSICMLGLSVISDYKEAYKNLYNHTKDNGEIIIADMKLSTNKSKLVNPLTVFLSKKYGGTYEGHKNSLEIIDNMKKTLSNIRTEAFLLDSFYYCIGKKN